jgi:hypothetical protein
VAELEPLDRAAAERPVRPELRGDRPFANDIPPPVEPRPVDGVRRHARRQWQVDAVDVQDGIAHPAGERHHRERSPPDVVGVARLEQLVPVDDE